MGSNVLLLGVDGGGTGCRARLTDRAGTVLGEAVRVPPISGLVLTSRVYPDLACHRAMPGAGRPRAQPDSRSSPAWRWPASATSPVGWRGADRIRIPLPAWCARPMRMPPASVRMPGADGGIVIVGTGSIGWANIAGQSHRVGGWGFPVSDEGSGAWLGSEAVRRVLWAQRWPDRPGRICCARSSSSSAATRMRSCAGRARRGRATLQPRAEHRRACGERRSGGHATHAGRRPAHRCAGARG